MTIMTPAKMAQKAYGSRTVPVRTPRGTEYAVFARITQRIQAAERRGALGFPDLAAALHDNRRLWSILATDVADDANALPRDLRARIFYLAEFTFQHTPKVLGGKAKAVPLVEINAAVMRGLLEGGASK